MLKKRLAFRSIRKSVYATLLQKYDPFPVEILILYETSVIAMPPVIVFSCDYKSWNFRGVAVILFRDYRRLTSWFFARTDKLSYVTGFSTQKEDDEDSRIYASSRI